jgi:hypothetical protein
MGEKHNWDRIKKMAGHLLITSLFLLVLLAGCEKNIDFKLNEEPAKLVVEATIENGQPPVVFLSSSLNYFSRINAAILANSFVHGAEVYVSDGRLTQKLKEYSIPVDTTYRIYYYSIDSSNLSTAFLGQLNRSYTLKINTGGQEYTSATTIPNITKKIDSLWSIPATGKDTGKVVVMVRATDPPGFGDYVRYWTKRNREPFLPGRNSVFDDFFIDGTTYQLQIDPGFDRNNPVSDDKRLFNKGDTVVFKLSNIDRTTYDFWRTMEYSYESVGNPFSTPVKVLGNISNGALGYFGGYASQYRTIIIPH